MAMTAQTYPTYQYLSSESGQPVMGFGIKPTSAPPDAVDGFLFWDTSSHKLFHWTGSAWSTGTSIA